MKKTLFTFLFLASSIISYGQLYDVHDLDDCRSLSYLSSANGATYTASTTNPDAGDTDNPNVSLITSNASNSQVRLSLPYTLADGFELEWSIRIYSASNTNTGSVSLRIYNSGTGLAGSNTVILTPSGTRTAGSWTTISGTTTLTTTNNVATFNTLNILPSLDASAFEDLYIDDIQFNVNPATPITDDTADLASGNAWLYDNRPSNTKTTVSGDNLVTIEENVATPSTDGNASTTVLKVTRGSNKFGFFKFNHETLSAKPSGTVSFRVYPECINTGSVTPSVQYRIRNNANNEGYQSANQSLTANQWNEVTINYSAMTAFSGGSSSLDESLIYFNFNDASADLDGAVMYIDAVQFPALSATWDGSESTDWANGDNWDIGSVPNSTYNVSIPSGQNPVISGSTGVSVNNLTVDGAGSLTVNSGGSLIVNGTSTGNITYNRTISTTNWYTIASPVVGQGEDDFATASGLAISVDNAPNQGLASYNTVDNTWSYYDGTASANTLTNGKGYSIKLAASGSISYTGSVLTDDLTPITLTTTGDGFNLAGNPYTSYVNSATMLTTNTESLDSQTIWVWNQGSGDYDPIVTVDNFQIAPGQGFFVKSDGAAGTLAINEDFQSIQGSDTFQKGGDKSEIHLNLSDGTTQKLAKVYYIDGASTGFDNGFDGPMFSGVSNTFAIFTKALNGEGRDLGIQSLPNDNYEGMVIPVGVNALAGKEITFSATALNLPSGIKVILEDRVKNVFTDLSETSYKVTLEEEVDGIGRFYLHTSAKSVLSVDDTIALDGISIFKTNSSTLRVAGLQQGNASVKLYNILGKQVLSSSFVTSGVKDIALSKLAKGMYIVQLQTETGTLNKKIIME
ncbi:T9SS type A sorting domain-containing protein [Polaribacter sp. Asnod6-C07]|uniref:T9SS type A sorting domain-containing protein n=1 Tax=Polaribacter sp. Asnod6-C07 TaxID=3160582 RepID=UPI00386732CC